MKMPKLEPKTARPRSVLVASDRLYMRIAQDSNSVALLEDLDALVVPLKREPVLNEEYVSDVRDLLEQSNQLASGSLLIKNPYDRDSYELAENAMGAFASAKYHALANAARLLGATEVHFVEAKLETTRSTWAADLKARFSPGGGDASATNEVKQKLKEQLEGRLTFPGSAPAPDEALSFLASRYLSHDQQMKDLVQMRTGDHNLVTTYVMKMSGTRESESNFRSALNIANAGPVKALDIGASFSKTAESVKDIEIVTEILFETPKK